MGDATALRDAYRRLVAAFGQNRRDDYFACFAEAATFVFHGVRWLGSLDEYRAEWERWVVQDGFAVLAVETEPLDVQMLGDTAVLTHTIVTRQRTNDGEEALRERETIVFAKQPDARWLVVHEHLSPEPE